MSHPYDRKRSRYHDQPNDVQSYHNKYDSSSYRQGESYSTASKRFKKPMNDNDKAYDSRSSEVERRIPKGPKAFRSEDIATTAKASAPTISTANTSSANIDRKLKNYKTEIVFMKKLGIEGHIHQTIQQVGEGTYGKVYKAKNRITGELVALKKLRLESEKEGFPITANREVGLLQSFDHPNIVGLKEMMVEKNHVYMVFPYMDHDLSGLLQQAEIKISDAEKKNIFKQLLQGIEYLHRKRVIHRDIKGSNILIDNKGVLKITDFGLARKMKDINTDLQSPNYTNRVITLWYRPPEILLGSTDYDREIDIWGIGCLLLELFTRYPIFQGINEIDQLWKIYETMGTVKFNDWPQADKLPWFELLRPNSHCPPKFGYMFSNLLSPQCFDLAQVLLEMNPAKRISAHDALKHPYFDEEPKESPLRFLNDVKEEWHEFEAKKKRKQQQKDASRQKK